MLELQFLCSVVEQQRVAAPHRNCDLRRAISIVELEHAPGSGLDEALVIRLLWTLGLFLPTVPACAEYVRAAKVTRFERDDDLRIERRNHLEALVIVRVGSRQRR